MPFSNGVISIFANIHAHDCIIAGCGVNALYRAFFISTMQSFRHMKLFHNVSMPYIGLSSFLPELIFLGEEECGMCQCPISGFLHFYMCYPMLIKIGGMCQCPISGFLHFYVEEVVNTLFASCVNALYRAFFISTLTSGNP